MSKTYQFEAGKEYTDSETGYKFKFVIMPDEVPESIVRSIYTKTFIIQAHRDSNPNELLERLRKLWADGLEPMIQDDEPKPTLEEECRLCGIDYEKLKRQIKATEKAGRTLTLEELEAV